MAGESKNGMQCTEFDALLTEALDGQLTGERLERFQGHARSCAVCGPLFQEAEAGQRWMKSLDEVEPPAHLVHNILLATSGITEGHRLAGVGAASWMDRLRTSVLAPLFAVARQPRFAMSFGMAFFSLSIGLNLAGVKASDLRHVDLRPSAIKRTYYETSGKVVKYYDNLRWVYEAQSRVREFRRVTTPDNPAPKENEKDRKNNTSGQPEQKQERNYSQGVETPVLASLPNDLPVGSVTTDRRLV